MILKKYAYIFVRSGSKGLPNKNLKKISGKSLTERSLDFALKSNLFEKVFLSTDSREIIDLYRKKNIEIINRPKKLATDNSRELDAWKHAVEFTIKKYGEFDIFVSLPSTSPFKKYHLLIKGMKMLMNNQLCDICLSVSKSYRNPFFNMLIQKEKKKFYSLVIKKNKNYNRQQAQKVYDISTMFYITRPKFIQKTDHILNGNVGAIEIDKSLSLDIDDEYDYKYAKYIAKNYKNILNYE